MIEIKQVVSKKDKKLFASYPLKLYKNCPYYVPNLLSDERKILEPKKNSYLEGNEFRAFLAYKDKKLVGRIAGLILRKDNELTGEKKIRFSRFECIDDKEVFKELLSAVARFGKEHGMEIIHGPWGFNDTDREGMLTEGFDRRSTYSSNYYYPYFAKNMNELGFTAGSKWVEKDFPIPKVPYDKVIRIAEKLKGRLKLTEIADKMSVKEILANYEEEFFDTMTEAYGHLDGYIPIVGKARKEMLAQFATIVNTRYISFLVDDNGKVAAFGICLPSICEAVIKSKARMLPFGWIRLLKAIKKPKELEMGLIGIRKEYRNSGINSIIIARIMNNIIEDGIEKIESNLMLEHNHNILNQWKFAESDVVKKRQTYVKKISELI